MSNTLRERSSIATGRDRVDELVLQIARLVRHRGFSREKVVSAMLLRYLPSNAGYDWRGETALRARLAKAALDGPTIGHLISGARLEIERMKGRDPH